MTTRSRFIALGIGVAMASGQLQGQQTFEVAGDGVIGDEILTTDGGQAALPVNGGTWAADGSIAGGGNTAESFLVSPAVEVPVTGAVTLKFDHRYSFEFGWDGGAVFVSVNGAPATYVEGTAFSANGYVGDTTGNPGTAWTGGEEVFYGESPDFATPAFVESVADLGSMSAGDTISVEFRGIWDEGFSPPGTDWEISGVTLEDSLGSAFLDVDFVPDGSSDFTVVNNANVQNPFVYSKGISTFEINADTLAADRYAPDVAGSVIDLNDASIVVEVLSGTLEANDEFTLFDLSGGTTLTGSIGSLTLPPGLWDTSTLAVDGRIILLLPEDPLSATPGAGFFIDASRDTDPLDGRAPDFAEGNPTGFDLMLDDDPAVTQVSVSSTNFPRIKSAYDMPGGATGNQAGAHPSDIGTTNQRSFQEAPGDWSNEDVTIEIWFKPDSLTPADAGNTNGQILFEDGGGTGFGFFVDASGEMQLRKAPGNGIVSYDLIGDPSNLLLDSATAEFIQVVGTYDVTVGEMELFVNGTSVGTDTPTGNDWSGGDAAGIGSRGDSNVGGIGGGQQNTESLDGQVAVFRVYRDRILTPTEVQANFTELSTPDTTPPSYVGLSPANLSTGVFFENDLVATFTENIALTGAGSVTLRNLDTSGDTVISLPDPRVSASGNQLIIDPATLDFDTNYAVLISADAIVDEASTPNAFAGITDETRWTFTTDPQDLDAPVITSLSPPDDGTGVQALDNLVVTFDETVLITAGDITLRSLTDNTESTISLTDDTQVSLDDNVLTISPTSGLRSETDYAVRVADGAITDISGNAFNGIQDDTTWNFTTGSFPEILFADNFDRPDSTDLNASAAGKSGMLGALNWGSGTLESLIDINNNTMRTNNNAPAGSNGAWAWVEHNFTGLQSMTVTFDIAAQNSGGDGRFTGFRMGQSLADISGEANSSIGDNAADVAVYRDNIGATRGIRVFEGTNDLGYFSVPDGVGTLSATFTFDDMDAGTPLNYEVFWNGESVMADSTTWSGTDENYVSVQSNTTADTRFDNFVVSGIAAGPGDYGVWADLFPGADLSNPNGDFDGDGLTNDEERIFGLDPTDATSVNPITVPLDATAGTFSFTRRDNALTGKFTDIETSFDLVTWTDDSGAMLTESGAPAGNGVEVVDVQLSPGLLGIDKLFVRVNQNDDGTLFAEDFEAGDGGYTATGSPNDWQWGAPDSDNSFGLAITNGNGGSTNCWGTNLGSGGDAPVGVIDTTADSILRSPDIDLTGVAGAELKFAAAVDADIADVVEVLVRDAGTDAILDTILPFGESPFTEILAIDWMSYGPYDLSTGVGSTVYLEFRYVGQDGTFLGLYLDDVSVIEVLPAP